VSDGVGEAIAAWTDAIVHGDRARAADLLHPGFELQTVGGYGNADREAWLAGLEHIDTRSLEALELDVAQFGDVAVAVGRWRWDASLPDRDLTGEYLITDVLVRDGGSWRPRWRKSTKVQA
jgi:ketosteroid isomerase-like protein